eukprot:8759516-Pyramimonas_sp.AAC.1
MHPKKGAKGAKHKEYPSHGIDELNSAQKREHFAKVSNVALVPLFMPRLNRAEFMGGAPLEHLSTIIRDDIMMWAFSLGNYKQLFKQNDAPIGQYCIKLPEAGGDTRYGMAEL